MNPPLPHVPLWSDVQLSTGTSFSLPKLPFKNT